MNYNKIMPSKFISKLFKVWFYSKTKGFNCIELLIFKIHKKDKKHSRNQDL
jgi:hypothetical protein